MTNAILVLTFATTSFWIGYNWRRLMGGLIPSPQIQREDGRPKPEPDGERKLDSGRFSRTQPKIPSATIPKG